MTLLGRDAPPSIETRSVFIYYQHLPLRLSFASLRPSRRLNNIFLWPRIVSASLPRAVAASQNVTTRGRQTRRESRLYAGSHARVARFTRKALWASEARDTMTSPVSRCRRGR